ncbi:MAG: YfcE family phosphodiesterase, partial [Firmicutes bacterium]|nr:YfcE family phosphodiesterase [Bacillota bacterium]
HGNYELLHQVVKAAGPVDLLLHAGDGSNDQERLARDFPALALAAVAGNCDPFSTRPRELWLNVGGQRLFLTHGDRYQVKWDLLRLFLAGKERGARLIVFGHTHCPLVKYEEGILLFNPGSLSRNNTGENPSYGWLELESVGCQPKLVFVGKKKA